MISKSARLKALHHNTVYSRNLETTGTYTVAFYFLRSVKIVRIVSYSSSPSSGLLILCSVKSSTVDLFK